MNESMSALIRCLRPHQWCKNLLVALPLLAAHRLGDSGAWLNVALAFASFSLGASAMYVLNDLRDRESDRVHPHKSRRPIASGEVSPAQAMALMAFCLLASALIAILLLPRAFLVYLVVYLFVTTAYSMGLKRLLMIDVLTLAALYALRMLAGGAAVDVRLSPWLLAFSMFLFLSIAFVKRYAELSAMGLAGEGGEAKRAGAAPGRAYRVADLDLIRTLGPTSGYMAVLIFALYLNSPDAQNMYARVDALWLVCPLMLYWITRLWFFAQRGEMHHDPVVFALTDPASYAVAAGVLVVATVASLP
jgi:4-hydroxybenzoate polyprenyltransferase